MPERKIEIKPIQFALAESRDNAASADASYASTAHAFAVVLADLAAAYGQRFGSASTGRDPVGLAAVASEFLRLMRSLDAQYGTVGTLPIENADAAVDEALTALAELDPWLQRLDLTEHRPTLNATLLAICHWAMCHDLRFRALAPIVNALAEQSNAAESRQATAAVFALMQGLIEHLAPDLSGDLEQSNPERPWRLLNLNLAITGIRTGDPVMIRYGFEQLHRHLPQECRGFFEEAHAIAVQPGFPAECQALIEAGYRRWTQPH